MLQGNAGIGKFRELSWVIERQNLRSYIKQLEISDNDLEFKKLIDSDKNSSVVI